MTLEERINEILNLYNYFNMAIIVDEQGTVEYFFNNRPDINSITEKDILGHCVLESCTNLTEDTSTLFYVLRTGKPVINLYQELITSKGEVIYSYCSTFPIKDGTTVIGAVEIAKYIDSKGGNVLTSKDISLTSLNQKNSKELYNLDDIKGKSPGILRIKEKIRKVSQTDSTVLIYGETGTGKELVAESIHSSGKRKNKKFVSQNCAAIPPALLESILFGTEKGSFTGAENRKGLIETAMGGTLFLDEINTMDIDTQSKILKAIDEKKIMRVGGTESVPVDIRIIAAVNVPPKECLQKKMLREDLYYRLRVVELKIPPLRDRKEDIPLLTDHFIEYFNHKIGKYISNLSTELQDAFMEYNWPGNVRELRNCIESGFNMAVTPIIDLPDVNLSMHRASSSTTCTNDSCFVNLKDSLRNKEREIIQQAYNASGKNITQASNALNISRQGLTKKLEEYGILSK
ncbi:MAG: sigma-54 interaction domain-containing protein [Anaerovoracaceae bacterium]